MKLTDRRMAILVAIAHHGRDYSPTLREIGKAVGLSSTDAVRHQLGMLARAGLLKPRTPHQPRTVVLAEDVAVSRTGLVARAVAVSHCPHCLISLPVDHVCTQIPEENGHA